jgi:hypothetical protein
MLTGGLAPFDGHILEVMSARTARDVPRITERAPHLVIPRELEDIVARLTRRRPADRHAGAHEVIAALDQVRLGPEARKPTEPVIRGRSPRRWLAAALVAACASGAVTWYAVDAGWVGAGASAAAQTALPASPAPATAPTASPLAAAAPAPPAARAPEAAAAPAADLPALEGEAEPVAQPSRTASAAPPAHSPAHHHHRPRTAREPVASPAPSEVRSVAAPAAPAAPEAAELPPPAAAPAPRGLRAQIDGVDVTGSLPRGEVARAVDRQRSAIARCLPPVPQTVIARFTIGETRRAQDVRTTGPTPAINACLSAAFAEVRTEQAPDVGDVHVTVRIAFVVKT